jgi:hypothetical protein
MLTKDLWDCRNALENMVARNSQRHGSTKSTRLAHYGYGDAGMSTHDVSQNSPRQLILKDGKGNRKKMPQLPPAATIRLSHAKRKLCNDGDSVIPGS